MQIRAALERMGLPAWFVAVDLLWVVKPVTLAVDARHYQRATNEWLAGGNPWAVTEFGVTFATGPHTMLLYAPTSLVPTWIATWLWMCVGIAAAVWLVRRLELPLWWFLFPPLLHATWNGNPQNLALALLIAGGAAAGSIAVVAKLYAAIPLLWRRRDLFVAGIVLAVTLPVLPWQLYLDQGLGVGPHLQTAWNGSAWRIPVLIPVVASALWLLRRDGGAWWAVPALFPATQFYYVAMALPAIRERRLVAAALALPMVLMAPIVVIVLAAMAMQIHRLPARLRREPEALD